jgi:transposase InsO family protein
MSNHPDADLVIDALLMGFERCRPDQELYDNGVVESLWATVKRNLNWIYDRRTWTSRHLLRSAIFDYIEGFYNPERIQKLLGYRSPADFESKSVA